METDRTPTSDSDESTSSRIPVPFALGGIGFIIAAIANSRLTPTGGFLIGLMAGVIIILVGTLISRVNVARGASFTSATRVFCPNCGHELSVQVTKYHYHSDHTTERNRDG